MHDKHCFPACFIYNSGKHPGHGWRNRSLSEGSKIYTGCNIQHYVSWHIFPTSVIGRRMCQKLPACQFRDCVSGWRRMCRAVPALSAVKQCSSQWTSPLMLQNHHGWHSQSPSCQAEMFILPARFGRNNECRQEEGELMSRRVWGGTWF